LDQAVRTEFRSSDGLTLVGDVLVPKSAPLVLLMHGGGQTRHSWAGAMRARATASSISMRAAMARAMPGTWSPVTRKTLSMRR
jgi:hypothetical protein